MSLRDSVIAGTWVGPDNSSSGNSGSIAPAAILLYVTP
jgi:hypothetical protein